MTVRRCLLAALAGVLAWLGYAGMDVWPLALVAFVPLFAALELDPDAGNGSVLLLGLLCGTVGWIGATRWLVPTLRAFAGFSWTAALATALVVWLYQAGLFAVFGWFWWRARRRGATAAVAAAAAFATAELLYPQVFPSYYAASFHGVPIALQLGDVGGPLLIGALCLAVNGAVYDIVARPDRVARRAALGVAAGVLVALAYGAVRMAQVDAATRAAPRLHVGIVQPDMAGFAKWTNVREGQRRLIDGTRDLERSVRPDLVVWPENAWAPGLPAELTQLPGDVIGAPHPALVLGSVARTRDGHALNRVVLVDERGAVQGTYDKVNLLVGGEWLPWADHLSWLRARLPTRDRLSPGHDVRPLPFREWRLAPLVCFEDVLPGFVRRVVRDGAPHLLVNLTNDAWFGDSDEPWIHLALASLRAVEHRRYLVRATNTGVSAVVDPVGRVVARSGSFTRETLDADVAMLEGRTFYETWGDWPGWLSVAAILWLAFARRRIA